MKTQLAIFTFGVISLLALPALADNSNGIPNQSGFPGQSSFSQSNSAPTLNTPNGFYNSPETPALGSGGPLSPGAAGIAAPPGANPDATNYNYPAPSNFGTGTDSAADTAVNTTGAPPTTATP